MSKSHVSHFSKNLNKTINKSKNLRKKLKEKSLKKITSGSNLNNYHKRSLSYGEKLIFTKKRNSKSKTKSFFIGENMADVERKMIRKTETSKSQNKHSFLKKLRKIWKSNSKNQPGKSVGNTSNGALGKYFTSTANYGSMFAKKNGFNR